MCRFNKKKKPQPPSFSEVHPLAGTEVAPCITEQQGGGEIEHHLFQTPAKENRAHKAHFFQVSASSCGWHCSLCPHEAPASANPTPGHGNRTFGAMGRRQGACLPLAASYLLSSLHLVASTASWGGGSGTRNDGPAKPSWSRALPANPPSCFSDLLPCLSPLSLFGPSPWKQFPGM